MKAMYLAGACTLVAANASFAQQQYNVVYIMADDHSTGAISAYGKSAIPTPNIDRIAAKGMRFNNCLCTVSLSSPSRASILTGKYSEVNGMWRNETPFDGSQQTLPKLMQQTGYQTAVIGKWHLDSEPTGFDFYKLMIGHGRNTLHCYFDCPLLSKDDTWTNDAQGGRIHEGYLTDVITNESIDWLEHRDRSKPFMLMVHHKAPHGTYEYPDKYNSILQDDDLPEPANFADNYQGRNSNLMEDICEYTKLLNIHEEHFIEPIPEELKVGTEEYKKWAYQTIFKGYYRLIASLDENVGRLLDYLEKTGLDKNTIVIYTSDNGFFMGEHGFFNKMWMYEESLHVPLLVYHPLMKQGGKVSDLLVSTLDYAPTILDCAGAPVPDDLQGRSLLPLLDGKKPGNWRKEHYYRYVNQFGVPEHYGIRTERYKLVYFPEAQTIQWELFDLKTDLAEMFNLYNNPKYKKIFDDLRKKLYESRLKFENIDDSNIK